MLAKMIVGGVFSGRSPVRTITHEQVYQVLFDEVTLKKTRLFWLLGKPLG